MAGAAIALPPPSRRPVAEPGETLLEARGIVAAHGARRAVRGAGVTLRSGEIVALMGRNGAGKTTLLRCLTGLHEPEEGSVVVVEGRPRPGRDVALVPQSPDDVLYRESVEEEVRTTLRASKRDEDARSLLRGLGVEDLASLNPRDLSAGQRLLVAIAAIVATGAPVLLLDEPTRGLDPESKGRLEAMLRSFVAGGGTALFATHDVELVAGLAGRVVLMADGEVIAQGSAGEVLGDSAVFAPQMSRVFGPGWLTVDQVLDALAARAHEVPSA
jgi:energy-coupling factor transport system ATP-binding protein